MSEPGSIRPGRPLRVGIDGRSLAGRADRGVSQYTLQLIEALGAGFPDDEWHLFLPGDGPGEDPLEAPNLVVHRSRVPGRIIFGAGGVVRWPRIDRLMGVPLDVLWLPAPSPVAVSRSTPVVLTVHDLAFETHPRDFTRYERVWHALARPRAQARSAAAILAVSEQTRSAVIERWRIDPDRVHRARPGVFRPAQTPGEDEIAAVRRRFGLPERYFLFAGALEPRKAPDLLARAYALAGARGLDAQLAVAGTGRLYKNLAAPGLRKLGFVTREELTALYAGALALVLVSRDEGFGFPPLEALAVGTPAVVSDLPVYRETLGDGALRVPFGDEEALAGALLRIAGDDALRAELVRAGREVSSRLTWDDSAARARAAFAAAAGA